MKKFLVASSVLALVLAGCGDTPENAESEDAASAASAVPTEATNMPEEAKAVVEQFTNIYFNFNKFDVRNDMRDVVDANAKVVSSANLRISVEGHTDRVGSEEYNHALGLKRANSIKDALVAEGVDGTKVDVVSFGKTKMICDEANAECDQKNRRVEIKLDTE